MARPDPSGYWAPEATTPGGRPPGSGPGRRAPARPPRSRARVGLVVALVLVVVLGIVAATSPIWHKKASPVVARTTHPSSSSPAVAPRLTPVSAHGFDALNLSDRGNENDNQAQNALTGIDGGWSSQAYIGSPELGHLKAGTGLILDLGRDIKLSQITVRFGPSQGADVQIKMGDSATRSEENVDSMAVVASATNIGGTHTFKAASAATGRYLVIWFTKMPPVGDGKYMAQIFNIVVRGTPAS
jgi:hypothetical protein